MNRRNHEPHHDINSIKSLAIVERLQVFVIPGVPGFWQAFGELTSIARKLDGEGWVSRNGQTGSDSVCPMVGCEK